MSNSSLGTVPPSQAYLDEYRGDTLITVAIVFIVLDTFFVILRYWARLLTIAGLGWDDCLIPLAWLANIGCCVVGIFLVKDAGVGYHLARVTAEDPAKLQTLVKLLFLLQLFMFFSVALPKVSICLLYLRVFVTRLSRIACYVVLVLVIVTCISFTIASCFQCRPFAYQWDKAIPGGACFDVEAYYRATSGPNVYTDVMMLLLPLPTIWQYQATLIRKVGLALIFLTGSASLIGSCFRFANFYKTDAFKDETWASVPLTSWSIVEPSMCLIAACLLTLRPLIVHLTPAWLKARMTPGSVRGLEDGEDERLRDAAGLVRSDTDINSPKPSSRIHMDETVSWHQESIMDLARPASAYIPLTEIRGQDRVATRRQRRVPNAIDKRRSLENRYRPSALGQQSRDRSMARMDVVEWPLRGDGSKTCDLG